MSMFEAASAGSTVPTIGLHSFKAGKLTRVEGTKKVKPDPRKGLIYLQEVDDLLHFYWKDRATNAIEDDLIIFPEEAELIKVKESPSGRVFALKFTSSSQINFYWMQERDGKNDEADVKRVNDLIADPKAPAPGSSGILPLMGRGGGGPGGASGVTGEMDPFAGIDLSGAAQSMGLSQDQLMQMLGSENIGQFIAQANGGSNLVGARPEGDGTGDIDMQGADVMDSTGAGAVSEQVPQEIDPVQPSGQAPASAGQQEAIARINDGQPTTSDGNNLRDILAGIRVPQQQQSQQQQQQEQLDLGDVLTPELILPLLSDAAVRQQLFPHLPASLLSDPPTEEQVRQIMTSVQWRQALSGLSYALNHGGESVIRSLGIDASQLQGTSGVEAFLRAVAKSLRDAEGHHDAMEE